MVRLVCWKGPGVSSQSILMASGSVYIPLIATAQNKATTTALTVTKPTGTVDGDLMVAMVCAAGAVTWTPPAGWSTATSSSASTDNSTCIFWKLAASEGASYAFALSASNAASGLICTFRNASMGFAGATVANTTTTQVVAQMNIPQPGGLLLGFGTSSAANCNWTPPSGMSTIAADSDKFTTPSFEAFSQARLPGATGTRTFVESNVGTHAAVLVFLTPANFSPPTPSYVASASAQNSSVGNTLVIGKPAGTADGDLMVAFMGSDGVAAATWTGDSGWTEIADQASIPSLRVAYKVAASEGSSYTFTYSSATKLLGGSILTYRGGAYDAIGSISLTSGAPTTVSPTGPSSAQQYAKLIGICMRGVATSTITAQSSMTQRVQDSDGSAPSYVIADETVGAGATGTRTFTSSGTIIAAVLLTIQPN